MPCFNIMNISKPRATIETTVLVAIWNMPVIFQGYFKITFANEPEEFFIFYRCQCKEYEQQQFRAQEFIPSKVQFTHLYNSLGIRHSLNQIEEDALYLLQYALFMTVHQMLSNSIHHLTYIDEIALSSIIERTTSILNRPDLTKTHEDLGFAVAMNFEPIDELSSKALLALLQLAE